jgi:hypothetical protein
MMEILLTIGVLYIVCKVGWSAVVAIFDVIIGSVKLIVALGLISVMYVFAQTYGLL